MLPHLTTHANFNQSILSLLSQCSHLTHLKQLQTYLITLGHGQNQFFSCKLVRFCSLLLGDHLYARLVFDSLSNPNVFLYAAMFTAYSSCLDSFSAVGLFNRMLRGGRPCPNEFIYPHVLRACSDRFDVNLVKLVHAHVAKSGFDAYGVVQTSLLDAYGRYSDIVAARALFDGLSERNVVSWTALISGYARVGKVGNVLALFEEMPERDVPSWNAVISGCTQNGFFNDAIAVFWRMVVEGVRPNQTTVATVLSASGHLGLLQLGRLVHGFMLRSQIGLGPFGLNSLVDMYGKCGCLKEARWIFDTLSDRGLEAWNSMVNCLALHGHSESAIAAFKDMVHEGLEPDEITFVGLLSACTHGGLISEGLRYFESMAQDYHVEPTIEHYGCVIDLLARAGRFEDATNIISDMKLVPDEVVWGSLLSGCRIYGETKLAEFAVRKLLEINPNNANYILMLANLHSEVGMWEKVGKARQTIKGGGKKLPGCSWIEVDSKIHLFYSSDRICPQSDEIYEVLEGLAGTMRKKNVKPIIEIIMHMLMYCMVEALGDPNLTPKNKECQTPKC